MPGRGLRRGRRGKANCAAARTPQSGGWCGQPRLLHGMSRESKLPAACLRSWSAISLAVTLAQRQAQLVRLAPRDAQAVGDQALAHHLDRSEEPTKCQWGAAFGPQFAKRPHYAIGVRMIDALVPGSRALRKLRIVANGV